ncbi:MAG: nucleotidyltransferase family protein, partial [Acutalibacteraceae bacterium]
TEELKKELTPEFHLTYMIFHIAKHFITRGVGIRFFLDIAFFSKQNKINYEEVEKELKKLCLFDFAKYVFTVCDKNFGTTILHKFQNIKTEEKYLNRFIKTVLARGIYGYDKSLTDNEEVGKIMLYSDKENKSVEKSFLKWFFPSFKAIRKIYPAFSHKPTPLLIFAYPYRWVRGLKKGRRPYKLLKEHNNIESYADFMTGIGLTQQ